MKNYSRAGDAPIAMMKRFLLCGLLLVALPALSFAQGGVVEYYHLDALGTVRAVTNEAGLVLETHNYLPFGEELCPSGGTYVVCGTPPAGQPKRFTGKERDTETGLDYFGARYLRASAGRFTTIDPVYTWQENLGDPQRWNRYAYARNNPLKYVDPDGRAIDVIADVGFILYDIFDIGRSAFRGEGPSGVQMGALGADILGAAIPFATGGGAALRAARAADKTADAARTTKKVLAPLPTLDRTGKVHGALPKAEDLARYADDDLRHLQGQLEQSVQQRIRKNIELGPDKAHAQRQGAEQQLVRQIEKHLADRK